MSEWGLAKALLLKYGLSLAPHQVFNSFSEALEFFKEHGRMFLKLYSPLFPHKSDVGFVREVNSFKGLSVGFHELIRERDRVGGVLVGQKFVNGLPLIIGGVLNRDFGPLVMVGSGGIYAEILDDVEFRLAPLNRREAERMVNCLKISKLFNARGKRYDVGFLVDSIVKVSNLVSGEGVKSFDVNPFILTEDGGFCVDFRVELG